MLPVTARAHANIALIKYWGKVPGPGNLPAVGSLSLTLDCFYSQTTIQASEADRFILNSEVQSGASSRRVFEFLDPIRKPGERLEVVSKNCVPTASGLASSASGFAALSVAANAFFKLGLSPRGLSELARTGSGSAARSIFPGLARMHPEGYAEPVQAPSFDLNLLVVHCSDSKKHRDSRTAMNHTAETSPYYAAWVLTHPEDLTAALRALKENQFEALGQAMEYSTLKMHASMMAAKPGIWYFEPLSLSVLNCLRELKAEGVKAYFTMDAGPHVKILCQDQDVPVLLKRLNQIPGVIEILQARPGPGAMIL
ncbi:MAG: diphosphomevalonate decarboxylase [Myxococcaceae bacterium]|nr:diphosphomevalonate decarboxylase [Myxococcaceae bacterium]MBH2005826.1 diphosphomevalonate decarboxylase [Myxococcaceae bacterium]